LLVGEFCRSEIRRRTELFERATAAGAVGFVVAVLLAHPDDVRVQTCGTNALILLCSDKHNVGGWHPPSCRCAIQAGVLQLPVQGEWDLETQQSWAAVLHYFRTLQAADIASAEASATQLRAAEAPKAAAVSAVNSDAALPQSPAAWSALRPFDEDAKRYLAGLQHTRDVAGIVAYACAYWADKSAQEYCLATLKQLVGPNARFDAALQDASANSGTVETLVAGLRAVPGRDPQAADTVLSLCAEVLWAVCGKNVRNVRRAHDAGAVEALLALLPRPAAPLLWDALRCLIRAPFCTPDLFARANALGCGRVAAAALQAHAGDRRACWDSHLPGICALLAVVFDWYEDDAGTAVDNNVCALIDTVLLALRTRPAFGMLAGDALALLVCLLVEQAEVKTRAVAAGALEVVVTALRTHADVYLVQLNGLAALGRLIGTPNPLTPGRMSVHAVRARRAIQAGVLQLPRPRPRCASDDPELPQRWDDVMRVLQKIHSEDAAAAADAMAAQLIAEEEAAAARQARSKAAKRRSKKPQAGQGTDGDTRAASGSGDAAAAAPVPRGADPPQAAETRTADACAADAASGSSVVEPGVQGDAVTEAPSAAAARRRRKAAAKAARRSNFSAAGCGANTEEAAEAAVSASTLQQPLPAAPSSTPPAPGAAEADAPASTASAEAAACAVAFAPQPSASPSAAAAPLPTTSAAPPPPRRVPPPYRPPGLSARTPASGVASQLAQVSLLPPAAAAPAAPAMPQPPAAAAAEADSHSCVVCLDAPRCLVLLPCRHLAVCGSAHCFSMLGAPPRCPLCREGVVDTFAVFT
jgi:hypothetical protein